MNRVIPKSIHSVIRSLAHLRDNYQLIVKTIEQAKEPITEKDREAASESEALVSLYGRGQKHPAEASTLNILLNGRRLGYSGTKKKIHIVREIGYGEGVFLCGALKASKEPLFIHHIVEEGLDLCKSCINLAEKGVH